jgi:hypothetical protein
MRVIYRLTHNQVGTNEFVLPLNTLINQLIGYCGCIALTTIAYHANLWVLILPPSSVPTH